MKSERLPFLAMLALKIEQVDGLVLKASREVEEALPRRPPDDAERAC